MSLPHSITSIEVLDDLLSEPTPGVIETLGRLEGDLLVLGVGGKMGPTLARMAVRASQAAGRKRRVIGVARFSRPELPEWLRRHGIEPLPADLLDPGQLAALPDTANVLVMTALKFGSSGQPSDPSPTRIQMLVKPSDSSKARLRAASEASRSMEQTRRASRARNGG